MRIQKSSSGLGFRSTIRISGQAIMRGSLSILVVAFLLGRGQGAHRIHVLSSRFGLVV